MHTLINECNVLPEDTFTVLRDGGLNGNEIRKNSR